MKTNHKRINIEYRRNYSKNLRDAIAWTFSIINNNWAGFKLWVSFKVLHSTFWCHDLSKFLTTPSPWTSQAAYHLRNLADDFTDVIGRIAEIKVIMCFQNRSSRNVMLTVMVHSYQNHYYTAKSKYLLKSLMLKSQIKNISNRRKLNYCDTFMDDCAYLSVIIQKLHKNWSFSLRISSVNVSKSAVSLEFRRIYWRNP